MGQRGRLWGRQCPSCKAALGISRQRGAKLPSLPDRAASVTGQGQTSPRQGRAGLSRSASGRRKTKLNSTMSILGDKTHRCWFTSPDANPPLQPLCCPGRGPASPLHPSHSLPLLPVHRSRLEQPRHPPIPTAPANPNTHCKGTGSQ